LGRYEVITSGRRRLGQISQTAQGVALTALHWLSAVEACDASKDSVLTSQHFPRHEDDLELAAQVSHEGADLLGTASVQWR
jgi:hypothetical protein